ncbi:ubiquitin-related domain-containing protein [Terfezia claveryi]|nr:ubiquitin-related domain-containing protein [Terfezia claveryi]
MATAATIPSGISTTVIKDAPLMSTAPGGEASTSTLPASETIASRTDEKSDNPTTVTTSTTTTELVSSIPPGAVAQPDAPARSTSDMFPQPQTPHPPAQPDPSELPSTDAVIRGPQTLPPPKSLSITLLLISGVRYPFTINSEFMSRHNLSVTDQDPMQINVSALKECIWKEWKDEEWNVKPPSANFIRLIHFGRLLDDRQQLKDCRLNPNTPNVVHMTVRPAESDDGGTQRSNKMGFGGRDRDQGERSSPTCRCVIL